MKSSCSVCVSRIGDENKEASTPLRVRMGQRHRCKASANNARPFKYAILFTVSTAVLLCFIQKAVFCGLSKLQEIFTGSERDNGHGIRSEYVCMISAGWLDVDRL